MAVRGAADVRVAFEAKHMNRHKKSRTDDSISRWRQNCYSDEASYPVHLFLVFNPAPSA